MLTMEMVLHKEVDFAPKFGKSQKALLSVVSFTVVIVDGWCTVSFSCTKAEICLNMKLTEPNSGAAGDATI